MIRTLLILNIVFIFLVSCANKNVVEQNLVDTEEVSFNAMGVASDVCACLENFRATKEAAKGKKAKGMTAMELTNQQKECEKQAVAKYGSYKEDGLKVAKVNALLQKECGNIAVVEQEAITPQQEVNKVKQNSTKTQVDMSLYKKDNAKNKKEPKRSAPKKNIPTLDVKIE